jgi:hypothetical protein
MKDHFKDTDQNSGTLFFIIVFSLFVFVSANNNGNHNSSSTKYTTRTELVIINTYSHQNIIACDVVRLPDLQKYYECAFDKTSLNQFSIQYELADHNRRIAQNFIQIQKTRLTIEPYIRLRFCFNLSFIENEDLPVLG